MSVVDVTEVSAGLFIVGAVFILLIFGALSLGILRMFEQRFRYGWICFLVAIVAFVIFLLVLNTWYL